MRKYGVGNVTEHFMSFNTICDATQVKSLSFSLSLPKIYICMLGSDFTVVYASQKFHFLTTSIVQFNILCITYNHTLSHLGKARCNVQIG